MNAAPAQRLIERIIREIIPDAHLHLLRLILSDALSQEELDNFLDSWDIEAHGATGALLMTFLMDIHSELHFLSSFGERLEEHLGFYIWKKSEFRKHCPVIFNALAAQGIPVAAFKGGDIFQIKPSLYLEMRDVDVVIESKDWKKASRLILSLGYEIINWDRHSFDAHASGDWHGLVDVHRYLPPVTGKEDRVMKDVLSRTRPSRLWGAPCATLSPEDLVFTYLGNIWRNIVTCRRPQSIPCNIINIWYTLEHYGPIDWSVVKATASRTESEKMMAFVIRFVNTVVPDFLPEDVFNANPEEISETVAFNRYIMCYLQARSHGLGVRTVLCHPRLMLPFLKIRPLYTFLKMFRDNQRFAHFALSLTRTLGRFSV